MEAASSISDRRFHNVRCRERGRRAWKQAVVFLSADANDSLFEARESGLARRARGAYLKTMTFRLMPRWGVGALCVVCASCSSSSNDSPADRAAPATSGTSAGGAGPKTNQTPPGGAGSRSVAGSSSSPTGPQGDAGQGSDAGAEAGGPPSAVNGRSVYAVECHGDSKDCNLASVPCLGVGSETPGVAAGWACANRCRADADCSDVPSGAEARASCVELTSAGHCVLVCKNENQDFACPSGMACYTPPQSPIGYCLWQ
jgi:hypothetical protein